MRWILLIVVLVIVALTGFFIIWARYKSRKLMDALGKDLALNNETLVFGPVGGLFRGSNQHVFDVTSNCVAVLTSRRFVFKTLTGRHEEIPLTHIKSVAENQWFAGQYRNGQQHLIIELKEGGKIGFLFKDHNQMINTLRQLLEVSAH